MLRYDQKSERRLCLRETARVSDNDNDRFFSKELKDYKKKARLITDRVADLSSKTNWSFKSEDVQNDERERARFLHLMIFYSIRDRMEPVEIQREKEGLLKTARTSIIACLVKSKIKIFELTPILALKFSYNHKTTQIILYFKISDSETGKSFLFDPLGKIFKTHRELLGQMCYEESLVGFPRDGYYNVDQRLGKVPLEFYAHLQNSARISKFSKVLLLIETVFSDPPTRYSLLNVISCGKIYMFKYFGIFEDQRNIRNSPYDFDLGEQSINDDIYPLLSAAVTFSSRCINAVSLLIRKLCMTFSSSTCDEYCIFDIELFLKGLKKGIRKIHDDNYPYEMARDHIGSCISGSYNKHIKDFVSRLNRINIQNINDSDGVKLCSPEGCSLKWFRENCGKGPKVDGACIRPSWSLYLFLEPVHEIISLLLAGHNDLKVSRQSDEAAEITKNDEIVCIILRIACEGGNFFCIKYGCIDI